MPMTKAQVIREAMALDPLERDEVADALRQSVVPGLHSWSGSLQFSIFAADRVAGGGADRVAGGGIGIGKRRRGQAA
jgi:hypothetical protein